MTERFREQTRSHSGYVFLQVMRAGRVAAVQIPLATVHFSRLPETSDGETNGKLPGVDRAPSAVPVANMAESTRALETFAAVFVGSGPLFWEKRSTVRSSNTLRLQGDE